MRDIVIALTKLMGVNPMKLIPLPPWESGWLSLQALLRGTTARIAIPFFPR